MVYIVAAKVTIPKNGNETMIQVGSLFAQVLSLVDRNDFARAVRQWDAERGAKGFRCGDQFVAMVFCQMASADSLREICGGLSTAMGKLTHLGLKEAPSRSTLSYANTHRPWQVYETVFYPNRLRRIVVWDEENHREIVLLTNHMTFAASTIARIYKDRWQIELFL